jgi:hypothetical protein
VTPPPAHPPAEPPGTNLGLLNGAPPPADSVDLRAPVLDKIYFERDAGWAVELAARGGFGGMARSDARNFFAFGGGLLRAHYRFFQVGGFFDKSDDSERGGGFMHFGGLAGAWLPYHNWVDFELALAFGSRRYEDPDPRYGPHGYSIGMPALSFIAGVSDRARSGNVGGRFGGQLIVTGDMNQKDRDWRFVEQGPGGELLQATGTTHVGGVSVSFALTIGLDYGQGK